MRVSQLQSGYESFAELHDALDLAIDDINQNGGWTVFGWMKLGLSNDATLVGNNDKNNEETKVLSEDITTHIVQLQPTSQKFYDASSAESLLLKGLKFDLSTI